MTEATSNGTRHRPPSDEEPGLTIEAPERSPPDRQITVRITGAAPNETIEFEASMRDADGVEWRSSATFAADARGVVDLTERAPVSGAYEGVEPMGWLWSMRAAAEQRVTALQSPESTTVRLRATAGSDAAERTIARAIDAPISRPSVGRDDLVGSVFEPAGDGPHPGVLVLHGSGGRPLLREAALLASHGFAAFAVQYVGDHDALPDELVRVPLSYFERAATWFGERPAVTDDRLGIVGHSRGGEVGLLFGARSDRIGAVVSYAGSGVVWDTPAEEPAWIDDGEPIPYVTGRGEPTLLAGQLDDADAATRRAATIPVEDIDGPVLFVSGADDPVWPAARTASMAIDRLDRSTVEYEYDHLRYDDAGHFITPPFLPKTDPAFGGTVSGTARADADSWPTALAFLRRGVGSTDRSPAADR